VGHLCHATGDSHVITSIGGILKDKDLPPKQVSTEDNEKCTL